MAAKSQTTLGKLFSEFHELGIVSEALGDHETAVHAVSAVETCGPGDLVFNDKRDYIGLILERRPSVVVTVNAFKDAFTASGLAVLVTENVAMAHALIKSRYGARDFSRAGWLGVHVSAVVHESARVHASAIIEPRVVIGRNTEIGPGCRIMAGTVIENDVVIGDETLIQPNAVIGYGCKIGREVDIGAGTVIGSEGYGFAQDKRGKSHKIPQTGIVVIEDRVRIGSNCSIDRATYRETRIGAGTKIDNLCHIAHNVMIGEDCLLTAMLCIAGSSRLGNRVITSGQTGVLDHVTVCDNVVLVQRAGVTKDVEKPGVYAGTPLQPLADYMKNTAVLKSAVELRRRIGALEDAAGKAPLDPSREKS